MNTVDQRILIPTPPDVVWAYISDISKNPQWQADCKSVTFLTSKRSGQGTRWRSSTGKGREQVIEITAWYDGLGYQYTYVDGMPFRESMGRIRLQEIPEGTVVQWTIQYEVGGLLGGVRGSLGITKQLESMMVASLKALWKQVNSSGAAQNWREAKSLMRDAPDAEARAQYKPRHPTAVEPVPASPQTIPARQPIIHEPPIAEDDTRPRPAVASKPASPPPPALDDWVEAREEPDFLADLARFQPPAPDYGNDTQPVRAITDEQARTGISELSQGEAAPTNTPSISPASQTPPDSGVDDLLAELDAAIADWPAEADPVDLESIEQTPDIAADLETPSLAEAEAPEEDAAASLPDATPAPAEPPISEPPPTAPYEAVTQAIERVTEEPEAESVPDGEAQSIPGVSEVTRGVPRFEPVDTAAMDTSQLSIWEIFGVQRPSETQELPAVKDSSADSKPSETASNAEEPRVSGVVSVDLSRELLMPPQRVGLRLHLRRSSVKLRRPE